MSERDVVLCWMTGQAEPGWDDDDPTYQRAVKALDAYAHELAEEIRAAWAAHDPKTPGNVTMLSALNAADLIDPSVSPVRPDEEPT